MRWRNDSSSGRVGENEEEARTGKKLAEYHLTSSQSIMKSCEMCDMGYGPFYKKYSDSQLLVDLCSHHGLIKPQIDCPTCHNPCKLDYRVRAFRCNKTYQKKHKRKQRCDFRKSIYKGTILFNRKIAVETILMFFNLYLRKSFSYEAAQDELGLSTVTINDLTNVCREVLISWCVENTESHIGGEGTIVEFDETKLGNISPSGPWVFGGYCRDTKDMFFVPVQIHNLDILFAVIEEHILPGTTIVSRFWKLYDCQSRQEFLQLQVSHKYTFVDTSEVNTIYNIKRKWKDVKERLPTSGRRASNLDGYLARMRFFMHYPNANERFHHFITAAAKLSPPSE